MSGHAAWAYDQAGRLTQEQRILDGHVYATSWTYDALDRPSTVVLPDNQVLTKSYATWLDSLAPAGGGDKVHPGRLRGPRKDPWHGMPGLRELEVGYSRVHVVYADLVDGGNITYTSTDPVLLEAIHAWFDRQLQDHGAHAAGA